MLSSKYQHTDVYGPRPGASSNEHDLYLTPSSLRRT
jgi:hypothetical protein